MQRLEIALSAEQTYVFEAAPERIPPPDRSLAVLNIFFVRALQKRLSPITVNAINPGFCASDLRRNLEDPAFIAIMDKMMSDFGLSTEEGSRHIVYGAVGRLGEEDKLRGQFLSYSRLAEVSDYVLSEDGKIAEEKLWVSLPAI